MRGEAIEFHTYFFESFIRMEFGIFDKLRVALQLSQAVIFGHAARLAQINEVVNRFFNKDVYAKYNKNGRPVILSGHHDITIAI